MWAASLPVASWAFGPFVRLGIPSFGRQIKEMLLREQAPLIHSHHISTVHLPAKVPHCRAIHVQRSPRNEHDKDTYHFSQSDPAAWHPACLPPTKGYREKAADLPRTPSIAVAIPRASIFRQSLASPSPHLLLKSLIYSTLVSEVCIVFIYIYTRLSRDG